MNLIEEAATGIGYVVLFLMLLFCLIGIYFAVKNIFLKTKRHRIKRKNRQFNHDDMFQAYIAGVEKESPDFKVMNPGYYTTLYPDFFQWMVNYKEDNHESNNRSKRTLS